MANIIPRREERGLSTPSLLRDPLDTMRDLLRWDPFVAISPMGGGGEAFMPSFEVKERKDAYVFKADLPGVKEEDVDVSLTGSRLTISGKRDAETKEENERYYAYERSYGTFSRTFTLPEGVDGDHVQADLKNGVLAVVLPKRMEMQPKKIALGSGKGEKAKA